MSELAAPNSESAEVQKPDRSAVIHGWLAKFLSEPWTSPAIIAPETSHAVLEVIAERWHLFDTTLKLRFLFTVVSLRPSKLQELSYNLKKIISLAKQDGDSWVSMTAELLQDYPTSGCLHLRPILDDPEFQELHVHVEELLQTYPPKSYPQEIAYMEEPAIQDCYRDIVADMSAREDAVHCLFKDDTEVYDAERRRKLQELSSATASHGCSGRPRVSLSPASGGSIFIKKKPNTSFLRSGTQRPTSVSAINRVLGSSSTSHAAGGGSLGSRQGGGGGAYQRSSRIQVLDLDAGRNIIQVQNEVAAGQQVQLQREREFRKIRAQEAMEERKLRQDKEKEIKRQKHMEKEKQEIEACEQRRKRMPLEGKIKMSTQREMVVNRKWRGSDSLGTDVNNGGSQYQRGGMKALPKSLSSVAAPPVTSTFFFDPPPRSDSIAPSCQSAPPPQPTPPAISPFSMAVDLNSLFQQCNVLADHDRSFIIGFLNGQQVRPPNLTKPSCQIILNEERYRDNENIEFLEQIVFEMNFDNGEWKKLRRRMRLPVRAPPCQQQNIPLPTTSTV